MLRRTTDDGIFQSSGLLMLVGGIMAKMELQNYANLGLDASSTALLGLSCLGALVALIGFLACCCTTRQHPALLYLVNTPCLRRKLAPPLIARACLQL